MAHDLSTSLAAHKCSGKTISSDSSSVHDPIDVCRNDLFVRTQEDHFVFPESVNHSALESLVSHCEVQDGIHKSLEKCESSRL
jgi:hypothetical protein